MSRRSDGKSPQKTKARSTQRKRPRRPRSKNAKALDIALKRLKRAVTVTISKADSVLASTETIAELAATRAKSMLLRSLMDEEVLSALYCVPRNEDSSKALRMFSRWLRDHF